MTTPTWEADFPWGGDIGVRDFLVVPFNVKGFLWPLSLSNHRLPPDPSPGSGLKSDVEFEA